MAAMVSEDGGPQPPIKLRHNTYFLPGDGIDRAVITYDICKYLDHDAKVRPGDWNGQKGYFITAYRNLTSEMVQDLKLDTQRYLDEQEQKMKRNSNKRAAPGPVRYENSETHARRARTGYATDTPGPVQSQASVYAPPPPAVPPQFGQDAPRHQQPSPYSDMQTPYPVMQSPGGSSNYTSSTYSSTMEASPQYAQVQPSNGQARYAQQDYDFDRRGAPQPPPPVDNGFHYQQQNAPMRSDTRPQFPPQHAQQSAPNTLRQEHQRYNEYQDQSYAMDTEEDNGPGPYEMDRGYQQRQAPPPVVEQRPHKVSDHRHRPERRR